VLYDLHAEDSGPIWRTGGERVAPDTYFEFADYALHLGYLGIVVGHAFSQLREDWSPLVVWGFHDGDLFPPGRRKCDGFHFSCR
jgi:hypothetical protein